MPTPNPRGFAALAIKNPDLLKAIAKKGGITAHAAGTGHEFTSEEAKLAGSKGGRASAARRAQAARGEPVGS
jgi:hypothetical protein